MLDVPKKSSRFECPLIHTTRGGCPRPQALQEAAPSGADIKVSEGPGGQEQEEQPAEAPGRRPDEEQGRGRGFAEAERPVPT